jgi:biopolymer transport protein ExbD
MHSNVCSYQNSNGIREVITKKQQQLQQKLGNKNELLVLIKPTLLSNYKNFVDALDEMKINGVSKYMIVNATAFEETFNK